MTKKVLVVENDRVIGELIAMVLRNEGYDVTLAQDYQRVPDSVALSRPDVVVIDSPDSREYGPGWDLAKRLHQRDHTIPMMMLTGQVKDTLEVGITDRGKLFAAAITKPFDIDILVSQIEAITRSGLPSQGDPFSEGCQEYPRLP